MTLRNIDTLFMTESVCVYGRAQSAAQKQILANLKTSELGSLTRVSPDTGDTVAAGSSSCAVIFDPTYGSPERITKLAENGCRSVVWAAPSPPGEDALRAANPHTLRLLGGDTVGVANTRNNLNITSLPLLPKPGKVALISQSQSLTAAAVDWALGRGIGFSWLACTGSEADIDIADMLDLAALDPRTRAVVLQLNEIRNPRKFMSAARAAARIKTVLVMQTQARRAGAAVGQDPVRSAAFARAGLVECESMNGLFDGLAALELIPRVRQDKIMVVGNGAGVCALASDALRRQNLQPVAPGSESVARLAASAPIARPIASGIDLADSSVEQTIEALGIALADRNAHAVLLAHSPVIGHPHEPLVEAIGKAGLNDRLLTVWLGLHTAQDARRQSGQARLATFGSVNAAARAIRYRCRYHETRELLRSTPPPNPRMGADVSALRERLALLADSGVEWLPHEDTQELLSAYDITSDVTPVITGKGSRLHFEAYCHFELGMVLRMTDESSGLDPADGFPPLDALLARRMLERACGRYLTDNESLMTALTQKLVRLAALVVDLDRVDRLDLHMEADASGVAVIPDSVLCGLATDSVSERKRLALSPYPTRMRHRVKLRGERTYAIRAIRPSDEPMLIELLESLDAEEIRLRFFSIIRNFSHDMAARMTQIDYDREVSLVASPTDNPSQLAATATIIADPDNREAEFAILVHHDHAGVGLGKHLLDCLLRQAHARGIPTVYGDILAENRPMLGLARQLGFKVAFQPEDPGSMRAEIDVARYREDNIPASERNPA